MPTLLIVAASPLDQDRLRLGNEVKKIKHALDRSRNREQWAIESNEAITVEDLRRALLDFTPDILHFSGHGADEGGLCFENAQGFSHMTHSCPLAKLLHHFKSTLKCVVLNACYSEVQAKLISDQIDYVIGMRKEIGDEAATNFAVAFYDAIFAGTSYLAAFELGCIAIDLENLSEGDVPILRRSPQLGGMSLSYTENMPEIENALTAYTNTTYCDRHKLTTKGEQLAKTMQVYYGDSPHVRSDKISIEAMQRVDDRYWKAHTIIESGKHCVRRTFYITVDGRAVHIEWEATVGYWSVPPKTFLALGSNTPIVARVYAELSNYYNYHFNDKRQDFQSIDLRSVDGTQLYGYIARRHSHYASLMDMLADGHAHDITLLIRDVDENTNHVRIVNVLSTNWIVPD